MARPRKNPEPKPAEVESAEVEAIPTLEPEQIATAEVEEIETVSPTELTVTVSIDDIRLAQVALRSRASRSTGDAKRQDIKVARRLAEFIEAAEASHKADDPETEE